MHNSLLRELNAQLLDFICCCFALLQELSQCAPTRVRAEPSKDVIPHKTFLSK